NVAREISRPFVVLAANGMITAVGTAFDVRRDSGRVVVTVAEGAVEVAPRTPTAFPVTRDSKPNDLSRWVPAHLAPGQQISYSENGEAPPIKQPDPAMASAWREGKLRFHRESLKYVVSVLNRYSRRRITFDYDSG